MAVVKFTGINEEELKKLEQALKEDQFVVALNDAADINEVQNVLTAKGIHFSLDEVSQIRDTLANAMRESTELGADELDAVSGGGTFTLIEITWKTKKGTTIKVNIPW